MSKLLISEPPIAFLPSLAVAVGVDNALALQQIHYWISNPRVGKEVAGRQWVRNTIDQWQETNFPFWTRTKVGRILKELADDGILLTRDDLNEHGFDRTLWYSLDYERLNDTLARNEHGNGREDDRQIPSVGQGNPIGGTTIPETTTENKTLGEPSVPRRASRAQTQAQTEQQEEQESKAKNKPLFEPVLDNEPEEELSAPRELSRNEVTSLLTDVFCEATGLKVPPSISHAAFNKLWRTPLWEVYELCDSDLEAATAAVKDTCRHMRDENLTISRPMSIINIARDRIAQGKHLSHLDDVQEGDEGGLWL